jgi:hypothetical protein
MASASLRISTLYLGIVILGVLTPLVCHADEFTDTSPAPEIEAKVYDLRTIRPSKSGRVYLFQKLDEGLPVDGKIFLLREGDTPVMALRVLKTYPDTLKIAAKKLLPYEGYPTLARESVYRAFEKIGNIVLPVPPSADDLSDLSELESEPLDELPLEEPAAEAPPPPDEELFPPEEFEEVQPAQEEKAPEESPLEEPGDVDTEIKDNYDDEVNDEVGFYFPNFFTMNVGLLPKTKVPGPDTKFGGGMLYSRNVGESFALEGGFYYYKSSGEEAGTTITTTIIPLTGNVRYFRRFDDLWTGYLYGGLYFPWVTSNVGATSRQIAQIQTLYPALGLGAFLQTGPNWYLRFNLGIDAMTVGVSLRF